MDYGVENINMPLKLFYTNSIAYLRFKRREEKFKVGVSLRLDCVLSPWFSSIFIESVVKDKDKDRVKKSSFVLRWE